MVEMRIRQLAQAGQGAFDQLDRRPDLPTLIGDDSEQMKRVSVIRVLLQRLAVQRLRPVEPSRLMVGEAGPHGAREAAGPPGISRILGECHG
jgi:hypothetical protein